MGTRADYYLGRGEKAEWLGSSAWDGHPQSVEEIASAETEKAFLDAVNERLSEDDGTRPKDGWPWPWKDSRTTDFAYAWDEGKVWISCFGCQWITWEEDRARQAAYDRGEELPDLPEKVAVFPDMTERKRVTLGKRSGVLIIGG